ncbi:MAG: hypothetical protein AB7P31_15215 [Steroidobacteraceae bacterium]
MGRVTPAYHALRERMQRDGTEVLIADGIGDVYSGNVNDPSAVKTFVNAMLALIPADSGALVLIGHIDKAAARNGSTTEGYTGTAAWHNAARARWYLRPETREGENGERQERTGDLLLELQKSNAGDDLTFRFEWDAAAHLFVGRIEGGLSRFDRAHQDRTERAGILAAFKACAEASPPVPVPAAMTGPRTALHVLAARPEFPPTLRTGRPAARRFWRHVEELRQMRALAECSIRRSNRHLLACLELTTEGVRQCAE